jgi:hypothetical protein
MEIGAKNLDLDLVNQVLDPPMGIPSISNIIWVNKSSSICSIKESTAKALIPKNNGL